jgi:hypothetical protein
MAGVGGVGRTTRRAFAGPRRLGSIPARVVRCPFTGTGPLDPSHTRHPSPPTRLSLRLSSAPLRHEVQYEPSRGRLACFVSFDR